MRPSVDREAVLDHYKKNGYAVIPEALTPDELAYLQELAQQHGGHGQMIVKYPELDHYVRHPVTYPLLQEILGADICFSHVSFSRLGAWQSNRVQQRLHRDIGYFQTVGGKVWDPDNPYRSTLACAMWYLSDVHDCCPSFGIIPNSHAYHTYEDLRADLGDDYALRHIRAPAGTAILYNITTYHARMDGDADCTHGRLAMHNWFNRTTNPPLEPDLLIPEELALSDDPETRRFYSLWSPDQVAFARTTYKQDVPTIYP